MTFDVEAPTPFIFMLRPRNGAQQWVARESYTLNPHVPVYEYTDIAGNLCQRLVAPPGEFSIKVSADILTSESIDLAPGAPFEAVPYRRRRRRRVPVENLHFFQRYYWLNHNIQIRSFFYII